MLRRTQVLGLVLAVSAVLRPSGQAPPPGDGRVPWRVAGATVEPLARPSADGNTILRVRFERGVDTPLRIPYDAGGVTVVLADDGTGLDARAGDASTRPWERWTWRRSGGPSSASPRRARPSRRAPGARAPSCAATPGSTRHASSRE